MDTCPSFGHRITTTIVSVRNELPGRLSEPINRKLIESLSVSSGRGAGAALAASDGGGAASVGKSAAISTVGLGWAADWSVGAAVGVGKNGASVGTGA